MTSKERRAIVAAGAFVPVITETQVGCQHLGQPLRYESCPTCSGNVRLKVFACSVHGTCQLTQRLAGVHSCDGCRDHQSRDPQ